MSFMRKVATLAMVIVAIAFADWAEATTTLRRTSFIDLPPNDPTRSPDTAYRVVLNMDLFEGLTRLTADGSVRPGVASSWTVSPDGKTYTFKLRPDAKWSDGAKVTADDFIFAWKRYMDVESQANKSGFSLIIGANDQLQNPGPASLGIKALDSDTLVVELTDPAPEFPTLLSFRMYPLPRHLVEKYGERWVDIDKAATNGPFHIITWEQDIKTVLARSPTYWNHDSVKIDTVIYHPIESNEEIYKRFRIGEIDLSQEGGAIAGRLIKLPDRVVAGSPRGTVQISFNIGKGGWMVDKNARKALSLATDRDILARVALNTHLPSAYFIPPVLPYYPTPHLPELTKTQADREREAKRLWALPGLRPKSVKVLHATEVKRRKMTVAIADMWKRVLGIDVIEENAEFTTLRTRGTNGDYEMIMSGQTGFVPLEMLKGFHSAYSKNYLYGGGGYYSKEFDHLIATAQSIADSKLRSQALANAETYLLADQAVMPIGHYIDYWLVSGKVKGCICSPYGLVPSQDLEIVQ